MDSKFKCDFKKGFCPIVMPLIADSDAGDGRQYPVGSLIVRPGCTFYQFHETHYNGGWNVYEGEFDLIDTYQ